jgi:hypothetical protein
MLQRVAGSAVAHAADHRLLTVKAWVRAEVSPCVIHGGQISTGTGFPVSPSTFTCYCHSTAVGST